jgi:biopolymer transport protein ExbD
MSSPQSAAARIAAPPRGGGRRARVEIIPLIDVIFFLLATFVLFTLSLDKIRAVPVTLPQASATARPDPSDTTVILQVSDRGAAWWNREPIAATEIAPRLLAYKAATATPRVLVTGDDRATYGDTIAALDAVRAAGITQVSIETVPRPPGR